MAPKKSSRMTRELPGWLNGLLVFGTLATVVYLEIKRPLRRSREEKLTRDSRNAAMALMSAATVSLVERPLAGALTLKVHRQRLGLIKHLRLPWWGDLLLSVLLLDYTLYLWHYLTHKVPLLWRFHQAHHVDLDLDASTALRFHAGEILFAIPWRLAQVRLLGISPLSLSVWQTATLMEIMFHHSNIRLPIEVERRLCRFVVTPRMHGIHHSVVRRETDSNWSTIFTLPDRLHGTLRLNVPQQEIVIGVPAYQEPAELTLKGTLQLPFTADRPSWKLVADGTPERKEEPRPLTELAE